MNKYPLLIPIGDARNYFDSQFNILESKPLEFLLVNETYREEKELQMLLMEKGEFKIPAQGLMTYLQSIQSLQINVSGGGNIIIGKDMSRSDVFGTAEGFRSAKVEDIYSILKSVWPKMELYSEKFILPKGKDFLYHKLHTLNEVIIRSKATDH